jgi:hypothetical protein
VEVQLHESSIAKIPEVKEKIKQLLLERDQFILKISDPTILEIPNSPEYEFLNKNVTTIRIYCEPKFQFMQGKQILNRRSSFYLVRII